MTPFVFSNLATSLDGKIAPASRAYFPLGTPEDRRRMLELRAESDAVLFGGSTLRAFRKTCRTGDPSGPQPMNVVLSSKLEGISPSWPFFRDPGVRRVLLVGPGAPERRLAPFRKSCEVVRLAKATPRRPVAAQAIEALAGLGVRRLLVEGGGGVMWEFVSRGLIDEYHVTITPRLVGGADAPTLVDGAGFAPGGVLSLKLTQCRAVGDELFLIYRRDGRRAVSGRSARPGSRGKRR